MAKGNDSIETVATFGAFSAQKRTCSLAVKCDRGEMNQATVDHLLAGAQCKAKIVVDVHGDEDAAGQETLVDTRVTVKAIADIHRYTSTPGEFAFSLSINKSAILPDGLSWMEIAGRQGKLSLAYVGAAEEKRGRPRSAGGEEEPEEEEVDPGEE